MKRQIKYGFLVYFASCLFGMGFTTAAGAVTRLVNCELKVTPDATWVTLTFNKSPHYHTLSLSNPQRWVLDLSDTHLARRLPHWQFGDLPFSNVRFSPRNGNDFRLVFDLRSPLKVMVSAGDNNQLIVKFAQGGARITHTIPASENKMPALTSAPAQQTVPTRHVGPSRITPLPTSESEATRAPPSTSHITPVPSSAATPHVQTPAPDEVKAYVPKVPGAQSRVFKVVPFQKQSRPVVVVIDPGHGGHDPGAMGPSGITEKNVVLGISRQLKQLIDMQPGMKAVLTRNGDYYLSLRQRLQAARHAHGDIFVAVHADAYQDNQAYGSSVYALSQRGASSEAARWLAAKENYSELGGVNLEDKSNVLRSVLIDLSQTATIGSSLKLGDFLLSSLHGVSKLHRRRVEQAPFVVLKSPDIPSVLVETGFISNDREERRLVDTGYQRKMAKALLNGICLYFVDHAPPGSELAQRSGIFRSASNN